MSDFFGQGRKADLMGYKSPFVNVTLGSIDEKETPQMTDKVVGRWGIRSEGKNIMMGWKVSGARRHDPNWRKGVTEPAEKPEKMSRYGKQLCRSVFKGW